MFITKLADHVIAVDNKYEYIGRYYAGYLSNEMPEFTVSATEDEIAAESKDAGNWQPAYLETLAIYRKICEILVNEDVILFHSSALEIDGKAVLFTAPSGIGKSTHASLWRRCFGKRVRMINDDKPLLKIDNNVTIFGTPYGGKDNLQNNISSTAVAIVVLHQASENSITKLSAEEAFPLLLNQTYRSSTIEGMTKTLPLVDTLSHLPVYSLGCTISDEAVMLVYNTLFG